MARKQWRYCEVFVWKYDTETTYRYRCDQGETGSGFDTAIEVLNYFGSLGWELITSEKGYYTFKREMDGQLGD